MRESKSMLVQGFLEDSSRRHPEKTALICDGLRFSYRTIDERSNRLAHALIATGVQRGDRVAICLENSAEAAISVFGILKSDATFLMINPTVKTEKLAHILNNCRAVALITHKRKLDSIQDCWRQTPHLRTVYFAGSDGKTPTDADKQFLSLDAVLASEAHSSQTSPVKNVDLDLAALMYTSGSTGVPKGVMLSHQNIVAAAASVTAYLENTPDDIILNVLPLFFGYGLYQLLMTFKCGGTVVLERSFAFPHAVLEKIAQERVTGIPMVPTIAAILLQMDLTKYDFTSLRYLTNAGAGIPVEHVQKLRKLLPRVKIFLMYGQTECIRTSYLCPDEVDRRPNSVGKAMPNCEVFIVDEQGQRLPPGAVGELVVRGANVMLGYWELPGETAKVLRPGPSPAEKVLHSGDLFKMDEEGYLYFVSRRDDIIKVRGQRVGPREIEEVLCRMPGVREAVVVGVPDPILGNAIKAVIRPVIGASLTEQAVRAYCASHLEDVMIPKQIEFRDVLPVTESGKVSRKELKAEL